MQQVTSNIYCETGFHGCNTSFVITQDGIVVVDTPMVPEEAKNWHYEITRYGSLRYVINTEPHTDHAAGNCWLGGTVVAHEGTRNVLMKAQAEDLSKALKVMAPDYLPLDPEFHYQLPAITFSQHLTLFLGNHSFHLVNMPGHTPCEVAVYVPEEKTIFTGDNMNLNLPIFVPESLPYAWLDSLGLIQQMEVDRIVPGHGNVCDKSYVLKMSDTIKGMIDSVKSAIAKNLSQEEALSRINISDKFPKAANDSRMERMLRMSLTNLYNALKNK